LKLLAGWLQNTTDKA